MVVFWQTTMNTGGVPVSAAFPLGMTSRSCVEAAEGSLSSWGAWVRLEHRRRLDPSFQAVANADPQVRYVGESPVTESSETGTRGSHDAGFDRVDQAEVAHYPWEERAFLVAGASQEERSGTQS